MVTPEAFAQIVDHVDVFDFGDRREPGNLCRFDTQDRWADPELDTQGIDLNPAIVWVVYSRTVGATCVL